MLKIFNRYKMKAEQLQQENEALKAQIMGLAFNLKTTEERLQNTLMQLQNLSVKNAELINEVKQRKKNRTMMTNFL